MRNANIIRAADHRRMRWANGGGWTTEIIAVPSSAAWEWRLSIADVASDGPFSVFPDVDRTIALLSGTGFALTTNGAAEQIIVEPFRPYEFDGAADTDCRLIDGPIVDLNLMVRRRTASLELRFIRVEPATPTPIDARLLLVIAGTAVCGPHRLGPFDALRVGDLSAPGPAVVSAGGRESAVLAVVRGGTVREATTR